MPVVSHVNDKINVEIAERKLHKYLSRLQCLTPSIPFD
jgi:hypothetical protein